MILYFSATGNCKYVASRIALSLQEKIISIVDCVDNEQYSFDDNCIGILSPTYFWGLPSIVKEFLETMHKNYTSSNHMKLKYKKELILL